MEIRPTSYAELAYLSTIRVLAHKKSGPEAGSAFVVTDCANKSFLVTARHLIDGATRATLYFYSGEEGPDLGQPLEYEVVRPLDFWRFHTDNSIDVAVAPLQEIDEFFTKEHMHFFVAGIPTEWFAPAWEHLLPSLFAGFRRPLALDEVLIAGYPSNYRDTPTSLPILRRGQIATPLWLDHEKRPVFLVDTTATQGTSGGPVFYVEEKEKSGRVMHLDSGRLILLGVFSETLPPKTIPGRSEPEAPPPNLGAAYRATAVADVMRDLGGILEATSEGE